MHPSLLHPSLLHCLPAALVLVTGVSPGSAQEPVDKQERLLRSRAVGLLERFASLAQKNAVGPRAGAAFGEILRNYDADHAQARKAL